MEGIKGARNRIGTEFKYSTCAPAKKRARRKVSSRTRSSCFVVQNDIAHNNRSESGNDNSTNKPDSHEVKNVELSLSTK